MFSPSINTKSSLCKCFHPNFLFLSRHYLYCMRPTQITSVICCCCWVSKSCLTLCNPMDCSLPGSSLHGISQARILKWVAVSSPRNLFDPGMEPASPVLSGRFFITEPSRKPLTMLSLLFSGSVLSTSLQPHGLQHARLPCPSPSPRACPLSWWCHSKISSSIVPFCSCLSLSQHQGLF